jgi:hypothetical protein
MIRFATAANSGYEEKWGPFDKTPKNSGWLGG